MEWLNYHHLLYFWVVAKEGSIVRASEELRLAHPTISGQIHRLEEVLGEKLLTRRGRNLVLTESGRVAFRYADEIFTLGREFVDTLKGRASGKPLRLVVGVADVLPPSLVRRFLEPAFRLGQPVQIVCRADKSVQEFLAELALHSVDVVIADGPAGSGTPVRAFSHPLGECGTTFFAAPKLAAKLRRKFPRIARRGPVPPPRRAVDGSTRAPALVRCPGRPTARRRRAGRQRAREGVRRGRPGRVRGAGGDRGRDPAPLSGARRRPLGGGSPAVLRHLGGAQDQAPGGGRDLRGGAPGHLRGSRPPRAPRSRRRLSACQGRAPAGTSAETPGRD